MVSFAINLVTGRVSLAVLILAAFASAQTGIYTIEVGDAAGTLTYQETITTGEYCPLAPGGAFVPFMVYSYSNFVFATSTFHESLSGGTAYYSSPGGPYCQPSSWRGPYPVVLAGSGYVLQFYPGGPQGPGASATIQHLGSQGYLNPKYVILGVTYAPPGPNSSVTYTNSTLVGNTTQTTKSFQNEVKVTVSVGKGINAWGTEGMLTGTESTDYTQGNNSSLTTTLSKEASVSYQTGGTGNAFDPVNHDYDTIWLWLNPLMIFTVYLDSPKTVEWNGYGYDNHDMNGMDIVPVQVGWLNGHFGVNPSIQSILARQWVGANERLVWPSGEGPGLTSTDIKNILQTDPFTDQNVTYSPSTAADGRFTQIPYPPNPLTYFQTGPGNGGGTTTTYNLIYADTSVVSNGGNYSTTQAFGLEEKFTTSLFWAKLSFDLTQTDALTWSHTWQNTLTTTRTLTNALSITGPGCVQTSPPCNPLYSGPGEFIVYQDNLYGTFMFYPAH